MPQLLVPLSLSHDPCLPPFSDNPPASPTLSYPTPPRRSLILADGRPQHANHPKSHRLQQPPNFYRLKILFPHGPRTRHLSGASAATKRNARAAAAAAGQAPPSPARAGAAPSADPRPRAALRRHHEAAATAPPAAAPRCPPLTPPARTYIMKQQTRIR